MVIAKRCLVLVTAIGFVTLCTVASAKATREGDKLMVRTKRQQCVCVKVSTANNQLQCNCDDFDQSITSPDSPSEPHVSLTNPTTSIPFTSVTQEPYVTSGFALSYTNPTVGHEVVTGTGISASTFQDNIDSESSFDNPCTCVQIVVSQGRNNQWSCNCDDGANSSFLDHSINRNFLSSALNQADYIGNSIVDQASQSLQYSPVAATAIPNIVTSLQQQQQAQNNRFQQSAALNQNLLKNSIDQSNYLPTGTFNPSNNFVTAQTQSTMMASPQYGAQSSQIQQNAFVQMQSSSSPHQFDPQYDFEPAVTTCVIITIPNSSRTQTNVNYSPSSNCLCGQNYIQCAENMCCHNRYRSTKKTEEESIINIIVDVLRNIKERLDHKS